jgi:ABC-type glycerol-3-phosphate transport system substrate-binding protein
MLPLPINKGGNAMLALGRTLGVAVVIAAASAGVQAQEAVDVAKAKAEGKVIWYTSTPIEQGQKIADAFQKETGIKVEMFRSGGRQCARQEGLVPPVQAGQFRQGA